MGCTVAELLSRISSSELTEWMAFAILESGNEDSLVPPAQKLKSGLAHLVVKKGS